MRCVLILLCTIFIAKKIINNKKKKNKLKKLEEVFSELPLEITTDILSRLPFKSVGRGSMIFKLVLVMFSDCEDNFGKFENRVQVHTLGSTIWRKKNGVVPDVLRQAPEKVSVIAHGCLHWMTVDRSLPNGNKKLELLPRKVVFWTTSAFVEAACCFALQRSRKCKFLGVQGHKDVSKKGGHKETAHYFVAYPFVGSLISLKSAFGVDCNTGR
ncbi:hypothetical protein IFM89_019683 [Coptis chinensis]|uniref:F-box domain-containing protein n=1 Tax=Coptis chinensis TaxID=261450 RepID=A0A835HL79_9MAGN|nr:hypothetical protein IFM89_019683 [Coptis chinensis]